MPLRGREESRQAGKQASRQIARLGGREEDSMEAGRGEGSKEREKTRSSLIV